MRLYGAMEVENHTGGRVGARRSCKNLTRRVGRGRYVHIAEGSVLLDQSMLTGESLSLDGWPGVDTYAGLWVRRGEATAEVTGNRRSTQIMDGRRTRPTAHRGKFAGKKPYLGSCASGDF